MTGQVEIDSYADAGSVVAFDLANDLIVATVTPEHVIDRLAEILAVDPPSVAGLTPNLGAGFRALGEKIRVVLEALASGSVDDAAVSVNRLLAEHSAHPHLANENGQWRLHHHPADMALLPMWHAICAEALARIIGNGLTHRVGRCAADGCQRFFFDQTKNTSRRFCTLACQNRTKAAAYRRRESARAHGR